MAEQRRTSYCTLSDGVHNKFIVVDRAKVNSASTNYFLAFLMYPQLVDIHDHRESKNTPPEHPRTVRNTT